MKRLGISSVLLALGLVAHGIRPGVAASAFIDAHNHVMPGLTPEAMISVMNELQVSKIVLMGKTRKARTTLDEGDQLTLRAYEEYPDRVIPFLGLNPVRSITPSLLDYLDRQLLRGTFQCAISQKGTVNFRIGGRVSTSDTATGLWWAMICPFRSIGKSLRCTGVRPL